MCYGAGTPPTPHHVLTHNDKEGREEGRERGREGEEGREGQKEGGERKEATFDKVQYLFMLKALKKL